MSCTHCARVIRGRVRVWMWVGAGVWVRAQLISCWPWATGQAGPSAPHRSTCPLNLIFRLKIWMLTLHDQPRRRRRSTPHRQQYSTGPATRCPVHPEQSSLTPPPPPRPSPAHQRPGLCPCPLPPLAHRRRTSTNPDRWFFIPAAIPSFWYGCEGPAHTARHGTPPTGGKAKDEAAVAAAVAAARWQAVMAVALSCRHATRRTRGTLYTSVQAHWTTALSAAAASPGVPLPHPPTHPSPASDLPTTGAKRSSYGRLVMIFLAVASAQD